MASLVLIKPDAMRRGIQFKLLDEFESRFGVVNIRQDTPSRTQLETHYAEHQGKDFFKPLIDFMQSRPLISARVLGEAAAIRHFMLQLRQKYHHGPNPENLLHASATQWEANQELFLWNL